MRPPLQVAFLTGQSDPDRCALSAVQQRFLDALPVPDAAKVRVNFPYELSTPPWRDVSLVMASWHNSWQYLRSRFPSFAEAHRANVERLIERADTTVFLAGSCGLELLANLHVAPILLSRVRVFAYGPVARRVPACEVTSVRGRRDWIARRGLTAIEHIVDCGHLDYLECADVHARCAAFVAQVAGPRV